MENVHCQCQCPTSYSRLFILETDRISNPLQDCFNCMPIAAIIDDKIFTMHGGLSPDLQSMEQIRRVMRPTDVPDTGKLLAVFSSLVVPCARGRTHTNIPFYIHLGLICDLLWSDPDREVSGWGENDRGVSFTFGADVVSRFLQKHDLELIVRAHQVVEEGYEFFAKRQLVTIFSAPNYCGEFDNAGAMMSVDETLLCSFQVSTFHFIDATMNTEGNDLLTAFGCRSPTDTQTSRKEGSFQRDARCTSTAETKMKNM